MLERAEQFLGRTSVVLGERLWVALVEQSDTVSLWHSSSPARAATWMQMLTTRVGLLDFSIAYHCHESWLRIKISLMLLQTCMVALSP